MSKKEMAVQKSKNLEFISLPASGHARGKTIGLAEFCHTFMISEIVLRTLQILITNPDKF